jgi:hypothetical protein
VDALTVAGGARELALAELLRLRLVRTKALATPAAGADLALAVPAGVLWELLGFHTNFVTSAVVAARLVILRVRDADNVEQARLGPQATQAASLTQTYDWLAGYGVLNGNGRQQMPLPAPPLLVREGWSLSTVTALIDAGDQYAGAFVTVREWSPQQVLNEAAWIDRHLRDGEPAPARVPQFAGPS